MMAENKIPKAVEEFWLKWIAKELSDADRDMLWDILDHPDSPVKRLIEAASDSYYRQCGCPVCKELKQALAALGVDK